MVHYRGGARHRPGVTPSSSSSGPISLPSTSRRSGARGAGLHLSAARRHQPGQSERPRAARAMAPRAGGRAPARGVHRQSTRPSRAAGRHDGHHASVPRQLPLVLGRRGGYDFVAEALFGELNVDGFFLEYDDARSGGFEPLRFVPRTSSSCSGLVTTKRAELESKDISSAASKRPPSTSRSSSSACRPSAGSPRRSRATR